MQYFSFSLWLISGLFYLNLWCPLVLSMLSQLAEFPSFFFKGWLAFIYIYINLTFSSCICWWTLTLWKTVWRFLLKIEPPYDRETSTSGYIQRKWNHYLKEIFVFHVHCNIIHHNQDIVWCFCHRFQFSYWLFILSLCSLEYMML